ncbi:PHP domain-containing protein [Halapricum hydrolyticum]|uniref:PHP domain-containing protein n=1 Tax=Halapricum hydrolyticum TaxID=2979991 RepID=A0AAE3IB09_9EURY|nr:PHP domain-containing protein [Halapricum hydrolyticum]MCU4718312.1 PHP domain-containing protein [Halapricum hydrolyticum]MCU4727240.1 PHP domain-containing protein [Halapricum hydrolyticum]
MLSVELHVHSSLSYDGRDSVDDILARAQDASLDALAITDHDEIDASLAAVEKASEYDLVGVPGMEVTSAAGHVLALGISDAIPKGLPFTETLNRIHDQGGIAVVPHPFQESRSGVMAKISRADLARADAIEVYNSRLLTGYANRQARQFATEHGIPMTAGSDAHIAEMVGRAITNVETDEQSVESILSAIADGRTTIEGRRTPWHISFKQAAGGAKRRVRARLLKFFE